MKTNAIIRIILFSLAILILGSILLGIVTFESFSFSSRTEEVTSESVVIDDSQVNYAGNASEIQHLEIEWAAGSITILPDSDSEQILLRESPVSKEKYRMHITQANNKLKIEFHDEDRFLGFGNLNTEAKDLVISVPADWNCRSLEIDAAAAEVNVSGLTIEEMEFDGASAVCSFEDCHIKKLDADTASGDMIFSGTLEELDFDAASAHFTGTFRNVPNKIAMDSMSGDLDITLPEDCGFTLTLDALSGDFSSDFPTNLQGDRHHYGDGRCSIQVNAVSGDVAIHKHNHTHTDSCYTENSTCPEYGTHHSETATNEVIHSEGHFHNESCYEAGSTCPDFHAALQSHVHNDDCYKENSACPEYGTHHEDEHH